jgi:hypothetical protein
MRDVPTHVPNQALECPGKERFDTSQSGACVQRCLFHEVSSFDSDQQPKRREIALVSGDVNEDFF